MLKEVTNIFYTCTNYHIRCFLILLCLCFCPPSPVPLLICFETEQFSLTLIGSFEEFIAPPDRRSLLFLFLFSKKKLKICKSKG